MSMPDSSRTSHPPTPKRVLACVLCQQRKVKCDRKFPCQNCIRLRAQCVPATLTPRRRRRKAAGQDLLDRLQRYEDLLRQNNVQFETEAHHSTVENESPKNSHDYDTDEHQSALTPSTVATARSEPTFEAKNIFYAMGQGIDDNSDSSHDGMSEGAVKKVWSKLVEGDDNLLFGTPRTSIDLSTLHPGPVQIFRLWQIYLNNVDPMLKVTHAPSLQARIIDATGNLTNINPNLEALMFSIYAVATLSLDVNDCLEMLNMSKEQLLVNYHFGCQQALASCGFLRSDDRDCLTALYLYLISIRPAPTHPQSISSILGVALRMAQRMGIDNESTLAKSTIFEAEMRRRLWWSLVFFDNRVSEMASHKSTALTPIWDCNIPLNINDSDLRPEMKEPPAVRNQCTDAFFAVVRSELAQFIRHTTFHLDFHVPVLKAIAKGGQLDDLERLIEEKYFKFCDLEHPLHFMTIWTTRAYLARSHLMQHYSNYPDPTFTQPEAERHAAVSYALCMLEADTKIMTSPLTKGFAWTNNMWFPAFAYIHITQSLKRQPTGDLAEQSWECMSKNYESRFLPRREEGTHFFKIFAKMILQAWGAVEASLEENLTPPRIVTSIRQLLRENEGTQPLSDSTDLGITVDDLYMSTNIENCNMSMQDVAPHTIEHSPFDAAMNQFSWGVMNLG